MSRVKAGYRRRGGGNVKKVSAAIKLYRMDRGGNEAFEACIFIGNTRKHGSACALGRNPRKALAAALRKSATGVGRRRGSFLGVSR